MSFDFEKNTKRCCEPEKKVSKAVAHLFFQTLSKD